ncbi:MAG: helix-turn-helix domain-containing protein [Acidimicrobiales bacterium]|nr:helix-turn-helix domain-containing protein [Acidimicrobiales bacterium]
MSNDRPLTITVEQAAQVLGVGRSTAYELVRSGDIKCIRLRRRIIVPVAYLAESLGVDRDAVWATLSTDSAEPPTPAVRGTATSATGLRERTSTGEPATLF